MKDEIKNALADRLKHPIIGTYVVTFLLYHKVFALRLFFPPYDGEVKVLALKAAFAESYNIVSFFVAPFFLSLFIVLLSVGLGFLWVKLQIFVNSKLSFYERAKKISIDLNVQEDLKLKKWALSARGIIRKEHQKHRKLLEQDKNGAKSVDLYLDVVGQFFSQIEALDKKYQWIKDPKKTETDVSG